MCPFAHGLEDMRSIVTSPVKSVETDYGNAGEFLFSILRSLEQVFSKDEEKRKLIEIGIEFVKEN